MIPKQGLNDSNKVSRVSKAGRNKSGKVILASNRKHYGDGISGADEAIQPMCHAQNAELDLRFKRPSQVVILHLSGKLV